MTTTTKKRMSPEEWAGIRAKWETDPRDGYTWIVNEMNLHVTHMAVLKRAKKEGWAKKSSLKSIVEQAQRKADSRKVAAKVSEKVAGETAVLVDSDAVDLRADVIEKHREEWGEHRTTFPMSNMLGEDGLGVARVAKTVAEAIKIRQEGERKAWGLDAIAEDTSGGVATIEELDAFFEQQMRRTEEMRESVRKERGGSDGNQAS